MEKESKISLPEALIMVMLTLFADVLEFLISLTGIGIIIGEIINFVMGAIIQFWLFVKQIRGFWKLGTNIIGTLADGFTASFFPIKTLSLLLTIYFVNRRPKAGKTAEKATGKTKKLAGIAEKLKKVI